jgi:alkanesulfonate monooxygenase SsuD/methylene tetrahydromethanopterin reductase-like flavin-dependent oxidoreductase (luciferase family)
MTEFSLIFEAQVANPSRANEQRVLREGVEHAMLADELGFDRWWSVEHHCLVGYAHSSAPEVLLSHIAAKTQRIRLGHGVVPLLMRMNPPIRVAERIATLDVLSGGRVDFGVGRSSSEREKAAFGVDDATTKAEVEESLRAIVAMWTEHEVEWDSELLHIPRRSVRPQPMQEPHPPLFMACTRPDTLGLAGRLGLGALSNGIDGPRRAAEKRKLYDAAIAQRDPKDVIGKKTNDHFAVSCFTTALDDGDDARRFGLRGLRYFMEASRYFFTGGERPNPDAYQDEENIDKLRAMTSSTADFGGGGVAAALKAMASAPAVGLGNVDKIDDIDPGPDANSAFGTPSDTIEFVEGMIDAGADEIFFLVQMGGIPNEVVLETITNIGNKVIPHFRKSQPTTIDLAPARATQ